jgi:hypothetical protein
MEDYKSCSRDLARSTSAQTLASAMNPSHLAHLMTVAAVAVVSTLPPLQAGARHLSVTEACSYRPVGDG